MPQWRSAKALKNIKLTTFDAEAETISPAAQFRGPSQHRRCLVPADGWYE